MSHWGHVREIDGKGLRFHENDLEYVLKYCRNLKRLGLGNFLWPDMDDKQKSGDPELVFDLSTNHGLDKKVIHSQTEWQNNSLQKLMIKSTAVAIKSLAKTLSIKSICLLTGFVAVLLPLTQVFLMKRFCELLGINKKAKYFTAALKNREKYDKFLTMTGPIEIGERVVCKAGTGVLYNRGQGLDKSVSIKLLPWGVIKRYKTEAKAQMHRL